MIILKAIVDTLDKCLHTIGAQIRLTFCTKATKAVSVGEVTNHIKTKRDISGVILCLPKYLSPFWNMLS